jgi:arsenate reductase
MSNITIYHNPACGTSRNTLEMIRNSGTEPTVIHYLETPPSRAELVKLIADMGITVRALLRKNVEPFEALGLAEDRFTDEQLIDFMLQHPVLINRPIVVTPLGTGYAALLKSCWIFFPMRRKRSRKRTVRR